MQHIVTYNNNNFKAQIHKNPSSNVHELYEFEKCWVWGATNGEAEGLFKFRKGIKRVQINDNENNFLNQMKDVMIISDLAGMGKTTFSANLATELQEEVPNCWVTRISSTQLGEIDSSEMQLTHYSDNFKYDNFLMKKLFKLSSPLERFIFEPYLKDDESVSKLLIILDGYDEINADYQKAITTALNQIKMRYSNQLICMSSTKSSSKRK